MIDILTSVCNKIWKTGEWLTTWTHSLVITLPKKGNLQLCQNYRTISLISHPSKVMLKTPVTSRRDHCRRASKFQSRREHHRTNIRSQDPLREIPAASAESLSCLHRLQEGPWQGMVRSLMDNCEEIQHQRQPHTSHWKSVWQGPECNHLYNEGSKPEILSRISQTTAAPSRLKIIWRDKNISLASYANLMRTLILSTFLYTCDSRNREKDPSPWDDMLWETSEHLLQRPCDERGGSQQNPECSWSACYDISYPGTIQRLKPRYSDFPWGCRIVRFGLLHAVLYIVLDCCYQGRVPKYTVVWP